MAQPLITTYRWLEAHERTNYPIFRSYWDIHRERNPGFAKRLGDIQYRQLLKRLEDYTQFGELCEIGSDLGRSTAWLSGCANHIDVWDNDSEYMDFCRSQCYNHQKRYGPITSVSWKLTDKNVVQVIQDLPKQYDCIKVIQSNLEPMLPVIKGAVKQNGKFILYEQDATLRQTFADRLDRYGLKQVSNHSFSLIIAEHK